MFPGTLRQLCQPPVLARAKLPIGALERLSRRTSTRPLTPPPAPEATRATKSRAGVEPKLMLLNWTQSPPRTAPMFWPPSLHASTITPLCALNDSAWIWLYALPPPPGLVGGGVVGPPPPPLPRVHT